MASMMKIIYETIDTSSHSLLAEIGSILDHSKSSHTAGLMSEAYSSVDKSAYPWPLWTNMQESLLNASSLVSNLNSIFRLYIHKIKYLSSKNLEVHRLADDDDFHHAALCTIFTLWSIHDCSNVWIRAREIYSWLNLRHTLNSASLVSFQ